MLKWLSEDQGNVGARMHICCLKLVSSLPAEACIGALGWITTTIQSQDPVLGKLYDFLPILLDRVDSPYRNFKRRDIMVADPIADITGKVWVCRLVNHLCALSWRPSSVIDIVHSIKERMVAQNQTQIVLNGILR